MAGLSGSNWAVRSRSVPPLDASLGGWMTVFFVVVVCPPVENGTNAMMTPGGDMYGSIVTFECLKGYVLRSGGFLRACQENGNWSDTSPVCMSGYDATRGVREKYATAITSSRAMGEVAAAIIVVLVVSICLRDLDCEETHKRCQKRKKKCVVFKRFFKSKKHLDEKKENGVVADAVAAFEAVAPKPATEQVAVRAASASETTRGGGSHGKNARRHSNVCSSASTGQPAVAEAHRCSHSALAKLAVEFNTTAILPNTVE